MITCCAILLFFIMLELWSIESKIDRGNRK